VKRDGLKSTSNPLPIEAGRGEERGTPARREKREEGGGSALRDEGGRSAQSMAFKERRECSEKE